MGVESPQPQEVGKWVETDSTMTFVPDEAESPVHPFTEATGLKIENPRNHQEPTAIDKIQRDEEEQDRFDRVAREADRDKARNPGKYKF